MKKTIFICDHCGKEAPLKGISFQVAEDDHDSMIPHNHLGFEICFDCAIKLLNTYISMEPIQTQARRYADLDAKSKFVLKNT